MNLNLSKHIFTVCLLLMNITASVACTIIAAGKNATTDGSIIVSQTDCGDECRIRTIPGRKFPKGSLAPVYWGIQNVRQPIDSFGTVIGYIPQVEQTYTYFHSAYSHINEHQLAIGESTISQRDELRIKREESKQIMTIEQAMIFAMERCRTAADALTLITHLVEYYGFLPSCADDAEALAIADPNEVWILEVYSVGPGWTPESGKPGAIWAAQRLGDDQVTIIPNWSIIKKIDLSKNDEYRASSNYMDIAVEKGWYDPKSGDPFIWQNAYSPIPREWATSRFWLFYSNESPNLKNWPDRKLKSPYDGQNPYIQYVEPLSLYPFSVKPDKKISARDVMEFQRSTFSGTIYDMASDPDWYIPDGKGGSVLSPVTTPFPTLNMRKLLDINNRRNVSRGGYGMVAQLRSWLPDMIGGIYYVYTDNQHVGPYLPLYTGVTKVPKEYSTHDPENFSEESAKWVYDFVDNLLYLNWQEGIKMVQETRNPIEDSFFINQEKNETMALALIKKNPAKAAEYLNQLAAEQANKYLEAYRVLRYQLLVKFTNNKQGINFQ
jgi:dipeptidase